MAEHPPALPRSVQRLLQSPYAPEVPEPAQARFLLDFGREALFGGAAGGGKSSAILMSALQFIDVPGYSALLLRSSFRDLNQPGALMDRAIQWWARKDGVRWDPNQKQFTFKCPGGGKSTITFGYMERENDHLGYQGAEYQFVGFDELTQHREKHYRYMFSRMRKPSDPSHPLAHVPLRMRATTNPGGPGHEWVYRRFIKDWEAWKAGEGPRPARSFYPSLLKDNPHVEQESYLEGLEELDAVTRAQLLLGDWNIRPQGRLFGVEMFPFLDHGRDGIPADPEYLDRLPQIRYWDLAATDPDPDKDPDWTAGVKLARHPSGMWIVLDVVHFRANPTTTERKIIETARSDGHRIRIYMEQEPGASGKTVIAHYRNKLAGYTFNRNLPSGSKIVRAQPVASIAGPDRDEETGEVKKMGMFRLSPYGAWHDKFLDELEVFPDGWHDDQVDALSGAFQVMTKDPSIMAGAPGRGSIDAANEKAVRPSAWRM